MSLNQKRSTLALLALAVSAFAIGTTEFISVGLLPLIADDLHISVTAAGLTVTLYALGVTFGAPVLTSLTTAVSRKTLLLALMVLFILGNSLAATSSGIALLLTARVISALSHGLFMSIASTIAADLVPENRKASAISIMFTGLTVATVTGVPLGTLLGQHMGWRAAFIAIAAVGVAALAANLLLIPSGLRKGQRTPLSEQIKLVTNGRLLLAFAITALGYGGTFAVFTYLSPLLHEISGFKEQTVAVILLVYGLAIAAGNIIGGKAANHRPMNALFYMFALQAAVLLILTFTAPFKTAVLISIIFMGLLAFMNVPGLQSYVVMLADRYAPGARDIASAVNIAAFNAGIAIGAYLGGIVTEHLGLIHTAWVGSVMVLGAVVLTARSRSLERRDEQLSQRKTA
ncbi:MULTISPECIES: MFS transporter [unclassified Paenibacillus]|uniref:MFS transporter n=1 Tax=unclassified Paenibacillus TaxID=185978 RepID=UPI002406874E|nr:MULTISPECIES: MFS transporter [unclassified Paenibacillus]MDF9839901.1 DHA1 family inner membrane transport protein [Paenibacillus sp. PastF-2]MDF9846483.1 DHA1 family inner membrane transport protein [Paenibacillus sp. PastM-2]MDF9853169.1 DHA1 family inner membrane transport protein [Paenibacillus sp. PastF-1]MDH6478327.1 DHA1 family inner membrane transport protein [Paenibacillus sp. PastH-2]MDH6506175.1 DHA1 family inner membrane transport protein [Paenibacillus sp. PastM-3]